MLLNNVVMTSRLWFVVLVDVVAFGRIVELVISARNARWSFAHGGVESGRGHLPAILAVYVALFVGAPAEVFLASRPFVPTLGWPMLVLVMGSESLRWRCIAALGHRWNTRVIIVPGLPLVRRGPYRYRWLRHPNYMALVVEGLALPLVHTAWITALVFTLANTLVLRIRIRVENEALTAAPPESQPEEPDLDPGSRTR